MRRKSNDRQIGRKISSEGQLVSWIKEVKDRERSRHRAVWADWIDILAAFHNRPDLRTTDDLRLISRLSKTEIQRLKETQVNWVQPHIRTLCSMLQRSKPIIECLPSTTDEADIQAAKIGDRFIRSEWRNQKIDALKVEKSMWLGSAGNAFWHVFYNSKKGPLTEDGVPIGEITTETVSPFKIIFEPHRKKIGDCRWCVISNRLPIDQVIEEYGESYSARTGKELTGDEFSATSTDDADTVTDAYLSMLGVNDASAEEDTDFVDADLIYHVPTKQYPEGIYAIAAGSTVLHVDKFPYPFMNRIPILHFREILCPWRMYGDTGTTATLDNQDVYNELRNLEKKYIKANAASKWFVPEGMRLQKDALTSDESEVVKVRGKPGEIPQRVAGLSAMSSFYQSINLAREEGRQSAGINEASWGSNPPGVDSGRAIIALQDMDNARIGSTIILMESEYSDWGQMVLQMAKNFYSEKRKISIAGEALGGSVWFFDRADLKDTTDVQCVPGTALPQNKIAKREEVLAMYKLGVLGDPASEESRVKTRRMLEFGASEDVHDDDVVHEQVAEKEDQTMLSLALQAINQGQIPSVVMPRARYDNDMIHLKIHIRRANSAGIRDMQQIYDVFAAHVDQHMQALNPPNPQQPPGGSQGNPPQGQLPTPTQIMENEKVQQNGNVATHSQPSSEESIIKPSDFNLSPKEQPGL